MLLCHIELVRVDNALTASQFVYYQHLLAQHDTKACNILYLSLDLLIFNLTLLV